MASRKAKAKLKKRLSNRRKHKQESSPARSLSEGSDDSPLSLRPKAIPGETTEDMAVFTRIAREKLSDDLQAQANAVADSGFGFRRAF